ncbi:MAG TPA: PIN domain-containing protein [Roseiarcus sp.]|nr:PIN domain-containing protein [Roseiarcus sp.]
MKTDFAIPAIVAHELYYRAYRGRHAGENLRRVDAFRFPVLELDREDVRRAGHLRATLAAEGVPIGPYDALIAAQALAHSLILITRNLREFRRIASL